MNDEQLKKSADARIMKVMDDLKKEDNDMGLYAALLGLGLYKLESKPGFGHNYYAILDAMYRYYNNYPEDKIDVYFYNTLQIMARSSVSLVGLPKTINVIFAQLKNQEKKVSPFEIKMQDILLTLRKTIVGSNDLLNNEEYMQKVSEYDDMLSRQYGHKIF